MLCARARIKAHDEVVADVVRGLQFAGGFGEEEGAPVGYAADDAVGFEDDFASGLGDSGGRADVRTCVLRGSEGGGLLFDFGEAAWADLRGGLVCVFCQFLCEEDLPLRSFRTAS
jgi:hypothetical protein